MSKQNRKRKTPSNEEQNRKSSLIDCEITKEKTVCGNNGLKPLSTNLATYNYSRAFGCISRSTLSNFHKTVIINQLRRFRLHHTLCGFERRVTALVWHPKYPQISVSASKGGELQLHNLCNGDDYFIPGIGPGGSILELKCSDRDSHTVYTASMTGKISIEDFNRKNSKVLFSMPLSCDNWFTSLDVCYNRQLLLTGDNSGHTYLVTPSGQCIWNHKKLHRSKVTHCEFNAHDPNLFVTSSLDNTVKLWDLRAISESKSKPEELVTFKHLKGVNSAYFSPSNGLNLLTTDQHSQLRVYSSPCWNESLFITQPHRQFQHMTPIKAIWHPMEDIIICGRYPDDNVQTDDIRTIDFYDASNGELLHNVVSPTQKIVSLVAINSTGDTIASSAGFNITFLQDENTLRGVSCKHECDEYPEDDDDLIPYKPAKRKTKTATKTPKNKSSRKSKTSKSI